MGSRELIFAALDADPEPIIAQAIDRLREYRGNPRITTNSVRFGTHGSFWINRQSGGWFDHDEKMRGGSYKLAQYVGLSDEQIGALYGLELDAPIEPTRLRRLRQEAKRRAADLKARVEIEKRARRSQAFELLSEAVPSTDGDPVSHYLAARGLGALNGAFFHQRPEVMTVDGELIRLAPSVIFPVVDGAGEIRAVHAVQLDLRTGQRLRHRTAKISTGTLIDGYVRFGDPNSSVVCIGEGPETVASVHVLVPHWRCLASCSGIRLIEDDQDLERADRIVLLAERGAEKSTLECGRRIASVFRKAVVYIAYVPDCVLGEKADMNDALQENPALVRHALSANQLKIVS